MLFFLKHIFHPTPYLKPALLSFSFTAAQNHATKLNHALRSCSEVLYPLLRELVSVSILISTLLAVEALRNAYLILQFSRDIPFRGFVSPNKFQPAETWPAHSGSHPLCWVCGMSGMHIHSFIWMHG